MSVSHGDFKATKIDPAAKVNNPNTISILCESGNGEIIFVCIERNQLPELISKLAIILDEPQEWRI